MTETTAAVKAKLHRIVDDMERQRGELLALLVLLPAPEPDIDPERSAEDLETLDESTELRSVILCVDQDNLQPAIRDLRSVAGERPGEEV